jgi:hypothetical protein
MNEQTLTDEFDYIVSHFDGNNNDEDNIAATLTDAAGLSDKSTFFYNNNLEEPNNR